MLQRSVSLRTTGHAKLSAHSGQKWLRRTSDTRVPCYSCSTPQERFQRKPSKPRKKEGLIEIEHLDFTGGSIDAYKQITNLSSRCLQLLLSKGNRLPSSSIPAEDTSRGGNPRDLLVHKDVLHCSVFRALFLRVISDVEVPVGFSLHETSIRNSQRMVRCYCAARPKL